MACNELQEVVVAFLWYNRSFIAIDTSYLRYILKTASVSNHHKAQLPLLRTAP
jgi:hypothetical protein